MSEQKDRRLLQLLAAIITASFVFGWFGVRQAETQILRKEGQEIALKWSRTLIENLEDVDRLFSTGQHSEHDRLLLRLATVAGGVIRHKVYNSGSKVVAATFPEDIGTVNGSDYFRDVVRAGKTYVKVSEEVGGNDKPEVVVSAYVPFISGGVFRGAFEVYINETSWAEHARKIGNIAIGGLFLILAAISAMGGVLIFRNIKYRHERESALIRAREEAKSATRAKSEFLANMSHELRTPINAINGFSEIIAGELLGPVGTDKYQEYAQDIHDSGKLLLSLINDILDLSKVSAGKMSMHEEAVIVPEIMERCIRLVKERAGKGGVRLSTEVADGLPMLFGDERFLLQILLNFLTNAIKFTPPGGQVTVHAGITVSGELQLAVADTGAGIPTEDIPKVLEPFGQMDNTINGKREGTGLGLPLSKKLVELHGGRLQLTSEPGAGTTVTAYFPSSRLIKATQVQGDAIAECVELIS